LTYFVPSLVGLMAVAICICIFSEHLVKACDEKDGKKKETFLGDPCNMYKYCCWAALVFGFMLFPLMHMFQIIYSMAQARQRRARVDRNRNRNVYSEHGKMHTIEDIVREINLTMLPSRKIALLEKTTTKMRRKLTEEEMKQLLGAFGEKSSKERAKSIMKAHNAKFDATKKKPSLAKFDATKKKSSIKRSRSRSKSKSRE